MPQDTVSKRVEQGDATRKLLISAAWALFADQGYASTSLREIVERAGVTKGAFYHHFTGKEDIFDKVFEEVHREIGRRAFVVHLDHGAEREGLPAIRDLSAESDEAVWHHLERGCRTYLEIHTEPGVQRIALIDGRSVLGWERWHEVHSAHSVVLLRADLRRAMRRQIVKPLPLRMLATLLAGALSEGCIAVAHASDPERALDEATAVVASFLEGLRRR